MGEIVATRVLTSGLRRRLLKGHGVVFMLHRFRDAERGVSGLDPSWLRQALAYLRREGYSLVSVDHLFRELRSEPSRVHGAVAFTIDDGYADQALIGAPVFAEFDCPVTTFVATGFLDRTNWFWWDRIAYVIAHSRSSHLRVRVRDDVIEIKWMTDVERERALYSFTSACKVLPADTRLAAVESLAAEAGVDLPTLAPPEYAPMSWEDLRRCEQSGMSFGPHTVTHPILSRTTDAQSEFEITESWRRLRSEARNPVAVFCYPNGQPGDYGEREFATPGRLGLDSVVGTPGYVRRESLSDVGHARFMIPRYHWPDDIPTLAQFVTGFERIKQLVTGRT